MEAEISANTNGSRMRSIVSMLPIVSIVSESMLIVAFSASYSSPQNKSLAAPFKKRYHESRRRLIHRIYCFFSSRVTAMVLRAYCVLALRNVLILTVAWSFGFPLSNSFVFAQSEKDVARSDRLRDQFRSGRYDSSVQLLNQLPTEERLAWLSEFRNSPAYRSSASGHSTDNSSGSGSSPHMPAGGGAIANYDELMNLIEATIDGDWANAGGTSTMTPYRNGVRINPDGIIERIDPNGQASRQLQGKNRPKADLKYLGDWQEPSNLRWVSLHQLDALLSKHHDVGSKANVSMELLGGLCRIDYVAFDAEKEEWLLGGPAGDLVTNEDGELVNRSLRLPPVLLEDLLCIAPHVFAGRGEFGCSIDPNRERLVRAYQFASTSNSQRALQRNANGWVELWRKELGMQQANIIGLSPDSPTGFALLVADAQMKRMGMGIDSLPSPIKSYWQETDIHQQRIDNGMVRWWYTLSDVKIPMDPDRKIYMLEKSNVKVQSEAQRINDQGQRVIATSPDLAADTFARNFTQHFDKIQQNYPIQGRLRHIFDLAVAMEIVRSQLELGIGKPFEALSDLEMQPKMTHAPRELDSVASTHKSQQGTTFAVVSGGVTISTSGIYKKLSRDRSKTNPVVVRSWNEDLAIQSQLHQPHAPTKDTPFWR